MRRAHVLLAGAVAIAGGAAFLSSDDTTPAASLGGTAIDGGSENVATTAGGEVIKAPAALDSVDLDKMRLEGDHYVAPLADGRLAKLTLDPKLQKLAEKLLDQSRAPRGAIVVMTPEGRILALAGRRTDVPEGSREGTFDWRLATEVWAPAASIFKLVTASALVKAGVDPDGRVCYHGGIRSVMESNLADHERDSRCESLSYGVAHSQNAILGKLAYQKLEPSVLEAEAKTLGWIDPIANLRGVFGELALPQTKDLAFAKAAAGFTGAKLSVVGGAIVAATFAGKGERPVPHLIASVDGVDVLAPAPTPAITEKQARAVARMMVGTCEGGSAAKTFRGRRTIRVAGKTGTLTTHKPFYMEHSWFVGFAPYEKPEIVVSVLFGNAMSWHLRGHEGARRLIDRALGVEEPARRRAKDRKADARRGKKRKSNK